MRFASMNSIKACSPIVHVFLFICYSLLLFNSSATTTSMLGNETDRLALLEFKAKITHDPLDFISSWNDSTHFCQWQGVTCSRRHQRVTGLSLNSLKLEGSLPPHIGNLSFLNVLDIQNNGFSEEIPREIGHLRRLWYLGLENNSFGGEIPANLSRCSNLQWLRLGNNELVGEVSSELGSLSKLLNLFIYFNNLSGEIPSSFGNLSSLVAVSAAGNNFVGSIPESISSLQSITYLAFGGNKLSGIIPPSIFNISSLMFLHLPKNLFHGSLPVDLGFTLPNLEVINVADNQLSGSIPVSISNTTNLMRLTIPLNDFTGKVPTLEKLHNLRWLSISQNHLGNGEDDDLDFFSSLVNCTSLELLAINTNNFGGILPDVGNFSSQLKIMSLENNQISGSIPTGIQNLHSLEILYLGNNQFNGSITAAIGELKNLTELGFSGNELSGNIPFSLGNLTSLTELRFGGNNLEGSIPPTLGKCNRLVLLNLSRNNLSGTIPPEVIGLSSLSIVLDLSKNNLTGSLPMEVGNLKNLANLDMSDNNLSGEIPISLGSCTSMEQLIMKDNFFQGSLPPSLSSLRGLQYLDLSRNNLTGQIPVYLENFSLQKLNLSFNDFEGEAPVSGIFKNASAVSLVGNDKLCSVMPGFNISTCSIKGSKKRKWSHLLKKLIPVTCGIAILVLMLSLAILYRLRRKRKEPSSESSMLASVLQVSYENLLKATGGFSSDKLIGVGNFGSVYKGTLDHSTTFVAVKVLNLQRRGAENTFMAECEALRNIRHRNLIKILTVCSSVDFQGNDFKALVYDFMVNGSLEDWLHPHPSSADGESRKLNLLQTLNIAIDVACALDYLHHHCETPIIHCDLKPSNVLLDNDMIGHVGDFGLAKFLPEATQNFNMNQTNSIGIRGTIGYTAPEYGMGSEVSTCGDVYSYGILLLEMFTNKRPTNELFKDGLNLHNFAKASIPDCVLDIVDPILLHEEEHDSTSDNDTRSQNSMGSHKIRQCLNSIIGVGVACSAELARERMNISDVAAELHSIRNIFLGTGRPGERRTTVTPPPGGL
ncbi:unnamed protein product [Camellia sinensis]